MEIPPFSLGRYESQLHPGPLTYRCQRLHAGWLSPLIQLNGVAMRMQVKSAWVFEVPTRLISLEKPQMGTITMSGTGRIKSRPDLAVIGVAVETQKKKSSDARRANNETMERLITAVRAIGIDPKDMQTIDYRLRETGNYVARGKRKGTFVKTGFGVQNTLVIKLRDLDKVDDVLDGLADAGATAISGPNFTVDNPAELRDKARKLAFERAKEKAELYCDLAGMKIVGLVTLSDSRSSSAPVERLALRRPVYASLENVDDGAWRGDHIAVGEEEVVVTAMCEFEIAPKNRKAGAARRSRRKRRG